MSEKKRSTPVPFPEQEGTTVCGPVVQVRSGAYIDPWFARGAPIRIEDVAASLSKLCRFNGHTSRFYSVAQHSVHVAYIVQKADPRNALAGLLHDAHEYMVGDMASPLKNGLGEAWEELEARAEQAVREAFGVPVRNSPRIKHADLVMLATERRDLMPQDGRDWLCLEGIDPLSFKLSPWNPTKAERIFLETYHDLKGNRP